MLSTARQLSFQLDVMQQIDIKTILSTHLDGGAFAGHIPGEAPTPLYIAFSGGRSSAYMTEVLLRDYSDRFHPIYITFANTGQEHEHTLDFVYQCQKHWEQRYNTTVIWLEARVNQSARRKKGAGTRYNVVDFFSATRNHEIDGPFHNVIKKYGLPSPSSPNVCNRELKLAPQNAFRRDLEKQLGLKDIYTAIGIRGDEPGRHDSADDQRVGKYCYPMRDLFFTDKLDVLDFWEEQREDYSDLQFSLELNEELGNCLTCWKKSTKKLIAVAQDNVNHFHFFSHMEALHSKTNVPSGNPPRRFFRGYLSVDDMLKIATGVSSEKDLKAQAKFELEQAKEQSGTCTEECQAAPNVAEIAALEQELNTSDDSFTPPDMIALFAKREPVLNLSSLL